jgi:hypothetical protein
MTFTGPLEREQFITDKAVQYNKVSLVYDFWFVFFLYRGL